MVRSCALLLAFSFLAVAEQSAESLRSLDLEQLLSMEVTSVRRGRQRVDRTAAAVHVITQEDIRRSGVTSIPEALRLVPGMHVARINGNTWAISARGFNGPFANKLLVMIDGRTVYSPLFSGVFWDMQDTLLEDVDRIEVIRGPAAALWGANAVYGVVNVFTRRAEQTQGTLVTVGAGSEDRLTLRMRHGGRWGRNAYYRFYAQQQSRSHLPLLKGEEPGLWGLLQGGFRLDWAVGENDEITLQGDLYDSQGETPLRIATPQPPFHHVGNVPLRAAGGNVLARWTRAHRSGAESTVQSYFDNTRRDGIFMPFRVDTLDLDAVHRRPLAWRQELLVGAGLRHITDRTGARSYVALTPSAAQYSLLSATVLDEIRLRPDRLTATVGVRAERSAFTGWSLQPTARLMWTPTRRHSVWGAVSRATGTPSRFDLHGRLDQHAYAGPQGLPILSSAQGNPARQPETAAALEAGWRASLHKRLSVDVAAFRSRHNGLPSYARGQTELRVRAGVRHVFVPLLFDNDVWTDVSGVEVAASAVMPFRWRLNASYTDMWSVRGLMRPTATGNGSAWRDPRRQWRLASRWDATRHLQLDVTTHWVDRLRERAQELPGTTLQAWDHLRLDARLGWRVGEGMEWSVVGQNLLEGRHTEYELSAGPALAYVRRAVYVRFGWRR